MKKKPAPSRDRTRRWRQRDRVGTLRFLINVPMEARAVLVEARWLQQWDEDDPDAVRDAVQRLLDNLRVDRKDADA